ncbi:hypothetical protein [Stakelama tenebrarum]|uniref:Uncharacterized protein n=1 Tax=Stakelama tenebrarum TaxID=2711215 RepID=A0A6G6Y6A7_9SPHN|nr:hypothetical protein [Sphingosinithalassobacter tenebrarum]QIG80439.1 hypothetical protein G5C33_12060 [Sphingosinithalassobacter tenebrarum]
MLAGLIFATEDAEDRSGTLAATLPFGGMTLLEYQVRLLIGAGAGQIMVAVARVTPALLGAVARAGKRGVPVDIVRSAEEAALKAHPLSRVLVLADSLVTTDPVMDRMAAEGAEALLVTTDPNSPAAIERLDMRDCWAGIARVPAHHLGAIARMPDDWDFQSALLRAAVEARAEHVQLTQTWERGGHMVDRSAERLASRSNAVLAALTERRTTWADRWIFTRLARLVLPKLVERNIPAIALAALGSLFGIGGLAAMAFDVDGGGLVAALLATALFATGGAMAALRGEDRRADLFEGLIGFLAAAAVLIAGWRESVSEWTATGAVLAVAAVLLHALSERSGARHRRWWGSPSAYLLILTPFAFADWLATGLGVIATYSFVTLVAAVETTREKA